MVEHAAVEIPDGGQRVVPDSNWEFDQAALLQTGLSRSHGHLLKVGTAGESACTGALTNHVSMGPDGTE